MVVAVRVLGVLNIGAFFALLFVAAYRLPGGVAATAGAIQPLVVAGLASMLLGELLRRVTAVAGATGVAGSACWCSVPRPPSTRSVSPPPWPAPVHGLRHRAHQALGTPHWPAHRHRLALTAGGLALLPVAVLLEGPPPALTVGNLAAYTWLGIAGTGIAYTAWFRGIDRLPSAP